MKILLVDLDQNLLEILQANLSILGYDVTAHHSGAAAIKALETGKYTTVLVGDELFDMSGREFCRALRGNIKTHGLYLVLMPRKRPEEPGNDLARPDDLLAKPFSMPELIAALLVAERRLNPILPLTLAA